MARRRVLAGSLAQMQREAARAQLAQVKLVEQQRRAAERALRARERALAANERELKRLYAEERTAEVDEMNRRLDDEVAALESILAATLEVDDHLDIETLKQPVHLPKFTPGALAKPEPSPHLDSFLPSPPSALGRIFGKAKHEAAALEGKRRYEEAVDAHARAEADRLSRLAAAQADHERHVAKLRGEIEAQHQEIDQFKQEFERGEPDAIVSYFTLVLEASLYPEGFPQRFRLAYVPESRQLVIEYEMPSIEVIPQTKAYKYVKARDEITQSTRPASHIKSLYASVLTQLTLRVLHEVMEADKAGYVETVVFNGYVETIDKATGQPARPYLITLRTTRPVFEALDLSRVDAAACLRHLNASVSKSPSELAPVKPVLEFNMVDPRFVQEADVLSELDQRPNLMELSPKEFESLITNLFTAMGLEAKLTQASRDGGVDCVAYDPRPIFGGKVVIQAKRYKGTVGVSAVRDLFGTMQNEGASKGILVTTSGYGAASFEFANGKPLELIDGSNLLYLLAEHAGLEAKIQPPTGWKDPLVEF